MNQHQQKIASIMFALQAAGLDLSVPNIQRVSFLMRYHLTKHQLVLDAGAAVVLLKTELAEYVIRVKGRNFLHVTLPASLN